MPLPNDSTLDRIYVVAISVVLPIAIGTLLLVVAALTNIALLGLSGIFVMMIALVGFVRLDTGIPVTPRTAARLEVVFIALMVAALVSAVIGVILLFA